MTEPTIHASAASVGGRGVLIRGASGSGKSSLLLQLLVNDASGTVLVADDRVVLRVADGRLLASPPPALAGLLEIRGQGIRVLPWISPVAVDLVVDLAPLAACPRLPAEDEARLTLCNVVLPRIFVASGAHDGCARVGAALQWPLFQNA
jgi:serine kinase of HPr protein (carbohydrate metabolism regulator)